MEAVSAILKVAQQIAKAAETARRNRTRCRELADRARTVGDILRDSSVRAAVSGSDTASRRSALGRLKAALDDARKLVESCHRQSGSWFSWLTSARTAARFRDVETRIDRCVGELGIANDARILKLLNDLAARRRPEGNSTSAGSKKERNRGKAKKKDVAKNGNSKSQETNRNKAKRRDVAKNGNSKSQETNRNKAKKEDAAKNGNKSGGTAAAVGSTRKKGGSQTRGKAAAAVPPRSCVVHSMEDDPTSCSVM